MCGIAGIVGGIAATARDPLEGALEAMAARGPDASGRDTARLGHNPVRFGARRLALVDPAKGAQPVRRPDGGLLVFNGEIYNHHVLRRSLEARGERFLTESDAEVLAVLLAVEGVDGLARVEGSYAFAWLPGPRGPLLLGRDPLGVRPLVWTRVHGGLAFASTIHGLLGTGALEPMPDLEAIADVLRDGVVPSGRTALSGVARVPPGVVLAIDPSLGVRRHAVPTPSLAPGPGETAADVLGALRAAVADRLRLERPVGLLLSGGVDSALVAALARERAELPAFTVTFPGHRAMDETHRARRTARHLRLEHHEVPCPRDPTAWVTAAASAFDEPFADASAIPTWGVGLAAGAHVRAVLTGTGGDEVFGGYRRYWLLGAGPWLRHVPSFLREPLSSVIERSLPGAARMLRAAGDPDGLYRGLLRLQPLEDLRSLVGPLLVDAAVPEPRRGPGPRTAREAMAVDIDRYLPDDLLVKEDRALMAHGVEGRHPFLDTRVRRAAHALEIQGSPARGQQKRILRAYVEEVIAPDLARAPKQGFAFPVDALYRGPLRVLAGDLLHSRSVRDRGFVRAKAASRLFREHLRGTRDLGAVIHALVMLELWARRILDGQLTAHA